MSTINTQHLDNEELSSANPIDAVKPVSEINAAESDRFAKLVNSEEEADLIASAEEAAGELTLEELQQQFRDSTFRSGFNRTIEKAKDIIKEMKE